MRMFAPSLDCRSTSGAGPFGELPPACPYRRGPFLGGRGPTRSSFLSTSNAGEAHSWESTFLNLSSNCQCGRWSLASPPKSKLSPVRRCQSWRLCKKFPQWARCELWVPTSQADFLLERAGLPRSRGEGSRRRVHGAMSSLGFLRAHTGKQYRRCGVLRERAWDV